MSSSIEVANLFNVKGMVFVITGGGSGLGEIMAQALDTNGAAKVFILGRRQASLDRVAAAAKNGSIVPIVCDVGSKKSIAAAVTQVEQQTEFVNAVIANSGIAGPVTDLAQSGDKKPTLLDFQKVWWEQSMEDSNTALDVNVNGVLFTSIAFLHLLEAGNTHPDSPSKDGYATSQIINTSSIAGFVRNQMIGHPYSTSKAALVHLTKMLATNLAPFGIRSNSIAPGLFPTEGTEFLIQGSNPRAPGSLPRETFPATRSGGEEDMAGAILYLTSRAGGFINGNILLIDGGMTSVVPASY